MGDKLCINQTLQYYGGNRDYEFYEDEFDSYPSLKFEIIKNLQDAKIVYEREYGDQLYKAMAKTMKIKKEDITFFNAIEYLEDYATAKELKRKTAYTFDPNTDKMIETYYLHYYKLGVFKDHAYIRLFTHAYFSNLVKEFVLKAEADQESIYVGLTNEMIDTLGLSLHFGNHLTFLAVMHQLYGLEEYFPSFGDELTWVLYYRAGKYWVYGEYEGERLKLESKANSEGEITLDDFIIYICSKLYFGDVHAAASGKENPYQHIDSPGNCRNYFDRQNTLESELFKVKLNPSDFYYHDSNIVDPHLHCDIIEDIKKGELEGIDNEDAPVIYVVKRPVVYVDQLPEEVRQDYYQSQAAGVPLRYVHEVQGSSQAPNQASSQTSSQASSQTYSSRGQSAPTQNSQSYQTASSQSSYTQQRSTQPQSATSSSQRTSQPQAQYSQSSSQLNPKSPQARYTQSSSQSTVNTRINNR